MDFTEIPLSFQIGLSNNFEVFYNTDVWRGCEGELVRNISGTYLPDSAFSASSFPAIILAPDGEGPIISAVRRYTVHAGNQPFVPFWLHGRLRRHVWFGSTYHRFRADFWISN
jgi:hypothetical protein